MKHLSILLCLLFIFAARNQTTLAVGQAVKNFFEVPISIARDFFTDASYRREERRTVQSKAQEETRGMVQYCLDDRGRPMSLEAMGNIESMLNTARTIACQCEAWGTCPTEVCACAIQCPEGFDIFKHPVGTSVRELSTTENALPFTNGEVPSRVQQTQGYCWGHARMTSQFNRLAFFKPSVRAPHDLDSSDLEEQNRAIAYYKDLIDRISRNQATDIPGFEDLQSFADHPAFSSYIGDKVAHTWADQAMSFQGLTTSFGVFGKSEARYNRVMGDIKERIDQNMQPTIVFTGKMSPFLTHAVLVSHYETQRDGSLKLCLRDNNYPEIYMRNCEANMSLSSDGSLYYSAWGMNIGEIKIAHNENRDAQAQARSLRRKCRDEKGCGR